MASATSILYAASNLTQNTSNATNNVNMAAEGGDDGFKTVTGDK